MTQAEWGPHQQAQMVPRGFSPRSRSGKTSLERGDQKGGDGPGLLGARNHQPRCQGARRWSSVSPSAPEPGINKDWEAGRRPGRPGQPEEDLVQFRCSFMLLPSSRTMDRSLLRHRRCPCGRVSPSRQGPTSPVSFLSLRPAEPGGGKRAASSALVFSLLVLPLFTRHVRAVLRARRWAEGQSPFCCPSQPPCPPRTRAEAPAPGALPLGVEGVPGNVPPNTTCETEGWGGARREWGERFLLLPNPRHNRRLEPCTVPSPGYNLPQNYKKLGDNAPLLPELPWGEALDSLLSSDPEILFRKLGTICKAGLFHLQTISLLIAQGRGSKARAIFSPPGVLGRWKGPPGGKGLGLEAALLPVL